MPAITDVEGLPIFGPQGKEIARVKHVLFHPSEPRVVALQIAPTAVAVVIERKPRYLPLRPGMLEGCKDSQAIEWPSKRLPSQRSVEKELGVSIDVTVIWHDMDVRLTSGERVGTVVDAVVSRKSGKVLRMLLSEGSLADVAVGRREIPGELVEGFDGGGVIVDESFRTVAPASGGLAAASGKGAAYARLGLEKAADTVLAAGVVGLGKVEKSFRSGLGRKVMRSLRKGSKKSTRRKASGGE